MWAWPFEGDEQDFRPSPGKNVDPVGKSRQRDARGADFRLRRARLRPPFHHARGAQALPLDEAFGKPGEARPPDRLDVGRQRQIREALASGLDEQAGTERSDDEDEHQRGKQRRLFELSETEVVRE